ncbi:DUF4230 domain-containing protein [Bacillus sp. AG4(2022)]|uniref:DUF4230 domain-containing protein n=1 Tax=Bacillus sp. AG4(2022) TaxID=2962594 RepID=UPI002882ACA0|nr:DUF4230 domain-containing protein [Bacillus sp. AG4(2022)]MDT0160426.1 DUF4230 domain-containing protein [Bacillus sp. AG4(2022)]
MKFAYLKFLLKALLIVLTLFIALNTVKGYTSQSVHPVKIVPKEELNETHYIINEQMILSKLQSKSEIVSMQQSIDQTYTDVDDNLFGKRHTEIHIKGSFKMGLETSSIKINYIDNETGIIYIKLGKPKLVSLEIPYDQIQFDKSQGFFRLSMSEKEEKQFYKAVEKNVRDELMSNKEVLKQAELFNQEHVRELLSMLPMIKSVVFE